MTNECKDCQEVEARIRKWIDHVGCSPKKYQRYDRLLDFVKGLRRRSCCEKCECIACDALKLLREIGEADE